VIKSEVYRQSPHDPKAWIITGIAAQGVPVIVVKTDSILHFAVSNSPAYYGNFTTQYFNLEERYAEIASGDNGKGTQPDTINGDKSIFKGCAPVKVMEYYQTCSKDKPHTFNGILFQTNRNGINNIRSAVNKTVAQHFGKAKYTDYFGSLAFTTSYMNLRVNETGKSANWVVPSVEYSNTQYCRDAFWISTMLSPEMNVQCLNNELFAPGGVAEYPLLVMLWAYRNKLDGMEVDLKKVQKQLDIIEKHSKNGFYYVYNEGDTKFELHYWADVIAFENEDVVAYNQGLYALVLEVAKKMELQFNTKPELALKNYRGMFNTREGFMPISKKKNMLGPDPLVPDFLSQLLFNIPLLDKNMVTLHYNKMINNAKTPYGFKSHCNPDGSYLSNEALDIPGYISGLNRDQIHEGKYQHGGSWMLYDMIFLMDAFLHGVEGAEEQLIWRGCLDFKIGNTTYECIDTKTGEPWKPNMGWNIAVYAFWRKLIEQGRATDRLFKAIDKEIARNK
jgi:hypothetical protein